MKRRPTYAVTVSAVINASADRVYGILADYRNGHPRILPPQFSNLVVERGGVGAGTEIRFDFRAFGRADTYRALVTEPEPGRVLREENREPIPSTTTFQVDALSDHSTTVTIRTDLPLNRGLAGRIERMLTTSFLKKVYARELALLSRVADPSGHVPE